MSTPAISNPANIFSAPAPANKQATSAPPDLPFKQVLKNEVADRRNNSAVSKAPAKEQTKAPQPNQANATQQAATPQKTKAADEAKPAEENSAADEDTKIDATVAPNDLLALVASLTQANAASRTDKPELSAKVGKDQALVADADNVLTKEKTVGGNVKDDGLGAADDGLGAENDFAKLVAATPDGKAIPKEPVVAAPSSLIAAKALDAQAAPMPSGLASLQQTFNNMQAVSGQTPEKLTPNVGTSAWDQALGQKVVWMAAGAQQSATLTLNPPDLGPMQIVLKVTNDQADAFFVAAQPEVRQALEAALPKLREMLGDAGIQLGQANVSTGMPNQNNSFGEQSQQASHRLGQGSEQPDSSLPLASSQTTSGGLGMVDTFA